MRRVAALVVGLCLAGPASSQERTLATYGDWSVRCENAPARNCEAATILSGPDNRPMAQLIVGRLNNQGPALLLVVSPLGVHLPSPVRIEIGGPVLELAFQRCTQQGCAASRELDDALLARLRSEPSGGRVQFQDGARQPVSLALSMRGFAQAQAALAARR